METTRIKWDEGMMTRCLARLTDYYPEKKEVKKQIPVQAAESDYSFELNIPSASQVTNVKAAESNYLFELDIPSADLVTNVKAVKKDTEWDDFKNFELTDVKKQVPVKAEESNYSVNLDIPSESLVANARAAQKNTKWDGFKQTVDMAL